MTTTLHRTRMLTAIMGRLTAWSDTRRLVEKSPDQREDLGLTLADMKQIGA